MFYFNLLITCSFNISIYENFLMISITFWKPIIENGYTLAVVFLDSSNFWRLFARLIWLIFKKVLN